MKRLVAWGIIFDHLGRVLLIKRKYDKLELPNYWSFPGWGVDDGETPEAAAVREVYEEVGLTFFPRELYQFEDIESTIFHRYIWDTTGTIQIQEEECDGYGWFAFEETRGLLLYERIDRMLIELHEKKLLS